MRAIAFLAGLAALPAHADLYRWIDPETGSVKYSSVAPPWYGDAERERRAPAVEVVPFQAPGTAPEKSRESRQPSSLGELEARWRAFLQAFAAAVAGGDSESAARAVQPQLGAYQGLVAQLDRLDPEGRKRRQAEEAMVLEKLKK